MVTTVSYRIFSPETSDVMEFLEKMGNEESDEKYRNFYL